MRSDRHTRVSLTLISVYLLVLALAVVGQPNMGARAEAAATPSPQASLANSPKPGDPVGSIRVPTATLPLRWRIPWVSEYSSGTTHCGTAIAIVNARHSQVNVEVELFDYLSVSQKMQSSAIPASRQILMVSGGDRTTDTDYRPFFPDWLLDISDIIAGYGRVHADDPRIEVAAFQYCRDAQGTSANIVSITQIPVYPVGSTADFFQAELPTETPSLLAAPEAPRVPGR